MLRHPLVWHRRHRLCCSPSPTACGISLDPQLRRQDVVDGLPHHPELTSQSSPIAASSYTVTDRLDLNLPVSIAKRHDPIAVVVRVVATEKFSVDAMAEWTENCIRLGRENDPKDRSFRNRLPISTSRPESCRIRGGKLLQRVRPTADSVC